MHFFDADGLHCEGNQATLDPSALLWSSFYEVRPPEGPLEVADETDEQWRKPRTQAAKEQDPEKLMEFVREITQLFDEKDKRHPKPLPQP